MSHPGHKVYFYTLRKTVHSFLRKKAHPAIAEKLITLTPTQTRILTLSSLLSLQALYMQLKMMQVRKETFTKNYAYIAETYDATHKEEFESEISKYGYPDTGNNLYSDVLAYKDWVKLMNA